MRGHTLFLCLLAILVHATSGTDVPCQFQQEVCDCSDPEDNVCTFTLEVEEFQTFTSYRIKAGEEISLGTMGIVYFLDPTSGRYTAARNVQTSGTQDLAHCAGINNHMSFADETEFGDFDCSNPMTVDGKTYRSFIAVNGMIPGPTLIVNENNTVVVNVSNKLTSEGVTIHWHGIHQRRTPWMDGVGMVSQCPIAPGSTFTYIFNATPPGTHWYHSHHGAQRTDGLFGALIVRESAERIATVRNRLNQETSWPWLGDFADQPQNHTLSLLDWQQEASLDLFTQIHGALGFFPDKPIGDIPGLSVNPNDNMPYARYSATNGPDGVEIGPVPYWSGLINGKGRHGEISHQQTRLSIFNIQAGNLYRFRMIGAQSMYAYKFSIDEHKLIVVASDGHFIEPKEVDYIIIHTGERYDFLLNATGTRANYWIRAETLEFDMSSGMFFNNHTAEAILHYIGEDPDPTTNYPEAIGSINSQPYECNANDPCTALNCPFEDIIDFGINCSDLHIHELSRLIEPSSDEVPLLKPRNADCARSDCMPYFLNFGFEGDGVTSAINGRNFKFPSAPYQTTAQYQTDVSKRRVCDTSTCSLTLQDGAVLSPGCNCIHVIDVATDKQFNYSADSTERPSVLMVISAANPIPVLRDSTHPVHLHGHSFHVVDVKYDSFMDIQCDDSNDMDTHNLCQNPRWSPGREPDILREATSTTRVRRNSVLKDTVIVPGNGYVIISFFADNPGYWFLHCHIEVHQLEGMALIVREYNDDQHSPAPDGINTCGDFEWTVNDFLGLTNDSDDNSAMPLSQPLSIAGLTLLMLLVYAVI